tara:strand:+ start:186 stop:884 length:699 start_codon:yes stop_codon:yes gene_type:complete
MNIIDISFDVYSDTPKGKDPDSHSPTLRKYHKLLWSKPLPNGVNFELSDKIPKILHHKSELGEFFLSSDSMGHTYSRVKSMSHIVNQVPSDEIDSFFSVCSTIGGYIIFPAKKVDNKMTINGSRGFNRSIKDRFDITLECIRRFYVNESSPLSDTLQRYSTFFSLFQDFKGYVDFFLLQDIVVENYSSIQYFLPFNGFDYPPLPNNVDEYQLYKNNMIDFIKTRNQRVLKSI